jgi:LPXTG-site transpeptidase (sortase) family protein
MSTNKKKKITIILAVIMLLVLVLASFFIIRWAMSDERSKQLFEQQFNVLGISTEPISQEERDDYTVPAERPRYIYIPAVNVDKARVIALGVKDPSPNGQQQLDVPTNIDDVGWYDCEINPLADKRCDQPTLPGGGSTDTAALLTGHTCFSKTMSCVFDNISKLKDGDTITIERGDRQKINYTVKKVETVKLADVDMEKAMRPIESGKEGLTLITCAGTYRGTLDANGVPTADKRVLVYAVRGSS